MHTFQQKYNGFLPGDIPDPYATMFGFQPRGTLAGQGDGNGFIEGWDSTFVAGMMQGAGETVMFWVDLSTAGLIDGGFSTASPTTPSGSDITGSGVNLYMPQAKIGGGNYIYVWNTYNYNTTTHTSHSITLNANYFGISAVTAIQPASNHGKIASIPTISVAQAYNMDKKIDDGLPLTGSVLAIGLSNDPYWVISPWATGTTYDLLYATYPLSVAIPSSTASCIDNGSSTTNITTYSTEMNSGSGTNCAISFQFQ